jgi:hypothetical protein
MPTLARLATLVIPINFNPRPRAIHSIAGSQPNSRLVLLPNRPLNPGHRHRCCLDQQEAGFVGASVDADGRTVRTQEAPHQSARNRAPFRSTRTCSTTSRKAHMRLEGIVNLADSGCLFRPRSVRAGQHNRRAKDLPTRAAAPPTQRAYHGRLS